MTYRLIALLALTLGACGGSATPQQACKNLRDRCGDLAGLSAKDVDECANDLPKVRSDLGDADYNKFLGCVKDASSCETALGCFGSLGVRLGGKSIK